MKFRPCIDIHNGKVKQIIGSSLRDEGDRAEENFVSERGAAYYAELYRRDSLTGGHVILLNSKDSPYYEDSKREVLAALSAWPGGLQVGGGVNEKNAAFLLDSGATHVIVTSYVFSGGRIDYEHLRLLEEAVGKEHIVLDVSCRKKPGTKQYYILTDRWQKYTETPLDKELMEELSGHCDEFIAHAVAVEGKAGGIEGDLVKILADSPVPVTYAGGISSMEDIRQLEICGRGKVDFTVGSALDLYGGNLRYDQLLQVTGTGSLTQKK